MSLWTELGYSPEEVLIIENMDETWNDRAADLYIDAHRVAYYNDFYLYLKENGINPFYF